MTTYQAGDGEELLAQPGHRPHPPGMTRSPQVSGGTRHAGQASHEQPPRGRLARLFEAADRRHVPLRTILVTVAVLVATYLAGKLIYRLRDIALLMLVAGFVAMLLNPVVAKVQRRVPRRGLAVTIVTLWAALVFISLAAVFGVPLVNGITHLAHRLPGYVASAQHGNGWIGHLVARYHVQSWVQRNTPRLAGYAQSLSKPALTVGKGAISLIVELFTLFVLVLLLLLEGPKMWSWTLSQMTPGRQATVTRIAADVSQKVTGYMAGNLLTSFIAGTVVFVTLQILGVPFPLLWGLWVALVDFLPMIGGALAGIPTVLFAFIAGGPTAGIVTAVVFAVYTQIENHVLNPVVMSKTVRINPLLVFIAVLAGASIGSLIGGIFGGFVAALLAIPTAGALQVLVKEVWQATAPDQPQETPVPAAEPEESAVQRGELSLSPPICGSMTVERPGALSRTGASRASVTPVPVQ
jgi:predicted PurR-regulated permease PerM